MLADLHSSKWQLFLCHMANGNDFDAMWLCVRVCEHLVIRCDKTTVHEIIDCSSISLPGHILYAELEPFCLLTFQQQ
jgi:hypothetical protein